MRVLREPLVHFAVLGAIVFGIGAWMRPGPAPVTVSADAVEALVRAHEQRAGRTATAEERAALTEQAADDEALYREAVALRLDEGDPVIRRRLVEKMRLLVVSSADIAAPTSGELAAYRTAHPDRYAGASTVSLTQVFLRRADHARTTDVLAQLRSGANPAGLGDPFPHGGVLKRRTEASLAGLFGQAFAHTATQLPTGVWTGPVTSSFGVHLVRVDAREASVEATDDAVRRDLEAERRTAAGAAAVAALRERYHVSVGAP